MSKLTSATFLYCLFQLFGLSLAEQDSVVLQLKWTHQFRFAGFYAAKEQGYYAQEGLDVSFRELAPSESPVDEVIFAKAQYGVQGADIIQAWEEEKPVVSIAVIFQESPLILIAQSPYTIPSQLVGKKVYLGNQRSIEIRAMLEKEGADLDSIQIIDVRDPLQVFEKKEADAIIGYLGNEPDMLLNKKLSFNVINPRRYGIESYGDCLFTTRNEIEANPDRVMRMVRASIKGWEYAMAHQEQMIKLIHTKYNPKLDEMHLRFEAQVIQEIWRDYRGAPGEQDPATWQQDADQLFALGILSHKVNVTSNIYTLQRLEAEQTSHSIKVVSVVAGLTGLLALVFSLFSWILWRGLARRNKELRLSETRLQQSLRATSDAVWDWPDLTKPMWWSAVAYQLFNVSSTQFLPTWNAFLELVHSDDVENLLRALDEAKTSQSPVMLDIRILRIDGPRWVRFRALATENSEQLHLSGLFQDIHQLKTAELSLRESETRFRQYFELGLVGMATVSPSGQFLQVNRTMLDILDDSESVVLSSDWKTYTHPLDRPLELDLMDSVLRGERPGYTLDKRFVSANKRTIYCIVATRAVLDENSTVSHWVMLIQDITQRRQGEQEKEKLVHQLSLKNRTLEAMLHTIGHDFRHPLVNVMWYSQEMETLLLDLDNTFKNAMENFVGIEGLKPLQELLLQVRNEAPQVMHEIRQGSKVLDRMLSGMLALSRLGRQPTEFVVVAMDRVVRTVTDSLQGNIDLAQCTIEIGEMPPCLGSEAGLFQVWKHLLVNAIQYRDPQRRLVVKISGKPVREWIVYTIDDNGIGIPASSFTHIFAPFFRLNPSAQHEGEGLGLTFVTRIVESHRGHIKVESELRKGSRFSIYLPKPSEIQD